MSQGNGSFASGHDQSEPDTKLPGVASPGEQSGVLPAEDWDSVKKDVPGSQKPQLRPDTKAESSGGDGTGDGTGQGSHQHHARDSGHGGREQTLSKDDLPGQVGKDCSSLVCFGEKAQTGAGGGSSLFEHPVDEQGDGNGGNAPNDAIIPKSAFEGTKEATSSGEDKPGRILNTVTPIGIPGAEEDKEESERRNMEMGATQQAKDKNAKVEVCSEIRTAVQNEHLAQSSSGSVPFFLDFKSYRGDGPGTQEEQALFMKELESFYKERKLEFKPPKFYGGGLNCLKLWRAVIRLGGYDQVTMCKLWRQVGESFNPPKTCTTVSWSFRSFYEKALLEYERQKVLTGELLIPRSCTAENQEFHVHSVPGKARREASNWPLQGWHTQHCQGNGDVGDQKSKERSPSSLLKHDKHLNNIGGFKRKATFIERSVKHPRYPAKSQMDAEVVDVGAPADWVKINVIRTKECFEVYALVPGLLREEVHVQSDAAGQVVISGEPEQPDNPWGVTPFKKIISLPSRIDPYQTSAVVTLHGQLVVRAPFERRADPF